MKPAYTDSEPVIWLNGSFLFLQKAGVSPMDRGFLYGDGLFETLRGEGGFILYLKEHVSRLRNSASHLSIDIPDSMDWQGILEELLRRNDLINHTTRVKIIVTRGNSSGLGTPHQKNPTLFIMVEKYDPPELSDYQKGLKLIVFRKGFSPPLAFFKSLNYLYYLIARQTALDAGANEALILDPSGNVSEASTGSLLIRKLGKWYSPECHYQLPGITVKQVINILGEMGDKVEFKNFTLEEIFSVETLWMLNSLVGIIPVYKVDDKPLLEVLSEEAESLRESYFLRGRK